MLGSVAIALLAAWFSIVVPSERMGHYHVPGVSIAYFSGGRIRWAKGYGLADVAASKVVTPDALFQAASVSKSLNTVGALRLVQAGKLNLDENVNDRFVSWKVPENEFTKKEKVTCAVCWLTPVA
jgi:CubicO group peptidase (beta-lactamase class C family)